MTVAVPVVTLVGTDVEGDAGTAPVGHSRIIPSGTDLAEV